MTKALWITQAGRAEIRETTHDMPPKHLLIQTLFTGISRGTERLIFNGQVPPSEHDAMRAPFQEGDFTCRVR